MTQETLIYSLLRVKKLIAELQTCSFLLEASSGMKYTVFSGLLLAGNVTFAEDTIRVPRMMVDRGPRYSVIVAGLFGKKHQHH